MGAIISLMSPPIVSAVLPFDRVILGGGALICFCGITYANRRLVDATVERDNRLLVVGKKTWLPYYIGLLCGGSLLASHLLPLPNILRYSVVFGVSTFSWLTGLLSTQDRSALFNSPAVLPEFQPLLLTFLGMETIMGSIWGASFSRNFVVLLQCCLCRFLLPFIAYAVLQGVRFVSHPSNTD